MKEISFTVNLPPVSKKNSQQICINPSSGKRFIMPSRKYLEYEQTALLFIPKGICINEPVNVKCLFYMQSKRKVDKVNLEEAIHDIMVKSGLLEDDNRDIIAGTDGTRVYYDKERPRTEVVITTMPNYEKWTRR